VKILFVINSLASPGGGAERVLASVSSVLAARGHDVKVLTFDSPASGDFYQVTAKVVRVRLGRTGARLGVLDTVLHAIRLRRTVKVLKPDAAIAFMHSAFIPAALALLGTGVPLIGSERTSFDHYRNRPVERWLLLITAPLLRALTVNAEGVRRGFPDALADRMAVVPNPVEPTNERADPVGPLVKTLLSVGGLRPEKDHRTLILAFASVASRFPDWRLRIVGGGPLLGELRDEVRGLGLDGRIELAGATRSIECEYRAAQLFVLPSRYEAFPNCLAEALAHGIPAIGFAGSPGTNELILPGVNGFLAGGGDRVESLAKCLASLMGAPALRESLARAAPASVAKHRLEDVATLWEKLLQGTMNGDLK